MAGIDKIHWTKWRYQRGGGKVGLKGEIILDRYPDTQMLGDEGLTIKEVDKSVAAIRNHYYVTYDRGYVIRFIAKKVAHPLVKGGLSKEAFLTLAGEAWDETKKDDGLTLQEIRERAAAIRRQRNKEVREEVRLRQENPEEWKREWQENKEKGYMRARKK